MHYSRQSQMGLNLKLSLFNSTPSGLWINPYCYNPALRTGLFKVKSHTGFFNLLSLTFCSILNRLFNTCLFVFFLVNVLIIKVKIVTFIVKKHMAGRSPSARMTQPAHLPVADRDDSGMTGSTWKSQ